MLLLSLLSVCATPADAGSKRPGPMWSQLHGSKQSSASLNHFTDRIIRTGEDYNMCNFYPASPTPPCPPPNFSFCYIPLLSLFKSHHLRANKWSGIVTICVAEEGKTRDAIKCVYTDTEYSFPEKLVFVI